MGSKIQIKIKFTNVVYILFSIFEKIMYPPEIVNPMKSELTSKGFVQLNSDDNIENLVKQGTSLIVINSICGCAAANARPGVLKSLENEKKPDQLFTSFAGVDKVATNNARELMFPFPPSSPCMAIFKDGEIVHMLEKHHIEGRNAEIISENLKEAYNEYC